MIRIPIFGGAGGGLLSDAKVVATFKNLPEVRALRAVWPSMFTDENGQIVYKQSLGGAGNVAGFVQKVEVESNTLSVILVGIAGAFLVLLFLVFFRGR